MILLNDELLRGIYSQSKAAKRSVFLPYLNRFMEQYAIGNANREAAFLAQVGHESGQLTYTEEIASGRAYEGRRDLGNTFKGDGVRFKGRGLIQITGRKNYTELSKALGVDFLAYPEWLAMPEYATQSACWWWFAKGLNVLADGSSEDSFKRITRIINGGYNGYADRHSIWLRAKNILG